VLPKNKGAVFGSQVEAENKNKIFDSSTGRGYKISAAFAAI